jgi:nonsense-mediated mRNA decay protein 3
LGALWKVGTGFGDQFWDFWLFWVYRESPQLLTLLLKKIKGISREVKLIDANFVWTEDHSRRLKVKITIQKEIKGGTVLQKTFVVEFEEQHQQWDDCKASYTPHQWTASVQIRQKVNHKRTFMLLEQLILKAKVHDKCIKVEEKDDGLDFQFKSKSHANSLVNFIQDQVPVRTKTSK